MRNEPLLIAACISSANGSCPSVASTSAVGRGAEALVGLRPGSDRPLSANPVGGFGLSVLNGLVGDRLERVKPVGREAAERIGAAGHHRVAEVEGQQRSRRGQGLRR